MRELFVRVKYLIYLLSFGLGQATPQFTLKHINGSGLGGSYWDTLMNSWLKTSQDLSQAWTRAQQWSSTWATRATSGFRQYPARHRDAHGSRQTYAGRTAIRASREKAWENHRAFLALQEPGTVGVAYFGPPVLAYRGLAPSILNKETKELIRRYAPRSWEDR